jgi:nucleoside-diphosphate-sugar epimerase
MVAVDNVVDAAILCAVDLRAAGRTYIVTDEKASSLSEIATTISDLLGKKRPVSVPIGFMRAVGALSDKLRRVVNLPVTRDQVEKLAANTRYSGERLRRELGFAPRVSLREGIRLAVGSRQSAAR